MLGIYPLISPDSDNAISQCVKDISLESIREISFSEQISPIFP